MIEFQECNDCRAKPGVKADNADIELRYLCPQCQMLRQLVAEHNERQCTPCSCCESGFHNIRAEPENIYAPLNEHRYQSTLAKRMLNISFCHPVIARNLRQWEHDKLTWEEALIATIEWFAAHES